MDKKSLIEEVTFDQQYAEIIFDIPVQEEKKINFRDEVVLVFFNAMLDTIIENWEPYFIEDQESIPSVKTVLISKPYQEVCGEDYEDYDMMNINGSNINFARKTSLASDIRRTTTKSSVQSSKSKSGLKSKSQKDLKSVESVSDKKSKKQRTSSLRKKKLSTVTEEQLEKKEVFDKNDTSWVLETNDEYAVITFKNGNVYDGPVHRKLMHGKGTFTWTDGTQYIGEFCEGNITGKGTITFTDQSWYEGDFHNSYCHGKGSMFIANNPQVYNGNWYAGKKHGEGWILFEPGNWYEGGWKENKMDGEGLRQYPSGSKYQGSFQNGRINGSGCMVWTNSDFYNGEWKDGMRYGYGEYTWKGFFNPSFSFPLENKYVGSWKNNLRHGVGVMDFGMEGGARYAGCYCKNKKHGPGIVVCENGTTVESNPLFINDKPVHMTKAGSVHMTSSIGISSSQIEEENLTDEELIEQILPPSYDELTMNESKSYGLVTLHEENVSEELTSSTQTTSISPPTTEKISNDDSRKSSNLKLVTEQALSGTASWELEEPILNSLEVWKNLFPILQDKYFSLEIPINTSSELIKLSYYTDLVVKKYEYVSFNFTDLRFFDDCSVKDSPVKAISPVKTLTLRTSTMETPSTFKQIFSTKESFQHFNACDGSVSNVEEITILEEKWLRRTIKLYLPLLKSLYIQYASVACLRILPYKPIMIKLFLWQMYRDCKIPEKGLTLVQTDILLAANPDCGIMSKHNPFEKIYFWQFLHSLILVSWELYGNECMNYMQDGTLRCALTRLLENDILPNAGQHTGGVLFDYRDLLPIQSVYQWYQTFGEPPTVRTFLNKACTVKRCDPPSYFQASPNSPTPFILLGNNSVPIGQNIHYLQDELPEIRTVPEEEKIKVFDTDPYRFKLFLLRGLGAKKVMKCVKEFCPGIVKDDVIVDMECPLTFLEFYEIVLMAAQQFLDKENTRKEREKIIEEVRRLHEQQMANKETMTSETSEKKKRKSKRESRRSNASTK